MAKTEILNNDAVTVRVDDAVAEVLETVEDVVENVVTITKNNPLIIAGALVVGVGIGGFIAYKVAVKRTTLRYEDILTVQLEEARSFYARLNKTGPFETVGGAAAVLIPEEEAADIVTQYQGKAPHVPYDKPELINKKTSEAPAVSVETEKVEVTTNVFVEAATDPADWDLNAEIPKRTPERPYVISFEEFDANEHGHENVSLTYYEGDETLADARSEVIDNVEYTVGEDNLHRFGHGSHDSRTVYVRNELLDIDFEVLRMEGSYASEVLSLEEDSPTELRHSRHPNRARMTGKPLRFRGTDE